MVHRQIAFLKNATGSRLGESLPGYLLASPALAIILIGLGLPFTYLLLLSFWQQDYLTIIQTFSWTNYKEVIEQPIFSAVLSRSIFISLLVTLVSVLTAYPIAYFLAFRVKSHKIVLLTLITLPFWTSYLLRTFSWKIILGYNGLINSALEAVGLINEPLSFLLYNATAVIISLTHSWAPFAILPIFVSLEKIDRSLIEAAADLGDSAIRRFFRVILPLSLPGVAAACILVFIPTVGDYITPKLVGGTDGVMIGNIIQSMFSVRNNWPLGAALSLVTMAAIFSIAGAAYYIIRTLRRYAP